MLYRWYDLDGHELAPTWYNLQYIVNLRIDARGHIREVQEWYDTGRHPLYPDSGAGWYDLDGNELSFESPWPAGRPILHNIRVDARGHIIAVKMDNDVWYDLGS